jgi:hypothetical protein
MGDEELKSRGKQKRYGNKKKTSDEKGIRTLR